MGDALQPLAAVRDPADGMTATVYRGPVGFCVVFRDDDSGGVVETRNFATEARALEYARRLIGAPVRESPLTEAVRILREAIAREWAEPLPCSRAQEIRRAQDVQFARDWVLHLLQRDPLICAPVRESPPPAVPPALS